MKNKLLMLIILLLAYFSLKYYIPYGNYIVSPINLLVTFLHEFGHSLGALLTGGSVKAIQISSDGSGYATISGGFKSIVLIGGYIGSAIFGNLLLYIGSKKDKYSEMFIYFIAGLMIFSGVFWFNSILSSIILFFIAGLLIFFAKKTDYDSIILQFLGITSLLYIIQDFNVGPSSDLSKFSEIFIIVPQAFWMYLWLGIVLIITGINLKFIIKK